MKYLQIHRNDNERYVLQPVTHILSLEINERVIINQPAMPILGKQKGRTQKTLL